MKAVVVTRYGDPGVLEVSDIEAPSPGPGEVAIAVDYAGVGLVDTLLRSGHFDLLVPPFVPGIEVSGVVVDVGEDVTNVSLGQRVAALLNDFMRGSRAGGYAEVATARADLVAPIPPGVDLADVAALTTNATTALLALENIGQMRPSDSVVVLGASGGIGGQAVRVARARGATQVVGVVGSSHRTELAIASGCTNVVVADDEASLGELQPDLVVDPVGGPLRERLIGQLAPLGRYVVVGDASNVDTSVMPDQLWLASTMVAGLSLGGIAHLHADLVRQALTDVLALRASGVLGGPQPEIVPLRDAASAHQALEARTAPGKVVLAV